MNKVLDKLSTAVSDLTGLYTQQGTCKILSTEVNKELYELKVDVGLS